MKFKIIINKPQTIYDGWTGHIVLPSGRRINLVSYCGGAVVAFNSRADLIKEANRVARANFEKVAA